jgi:dipeptidyl aminopeptidase/acylaminoacyl peptidase
MGVKFSRGGHRFLLTLIGDDYKLALHDASGALIRGFELGRIKYGNAMISGDGSRIAACVPERVTVFDAASGAAVAQLECRDCLPGQLSYDGRRLATNNSREVMLWDVDGGAVVWRDSNHAGNLREPIVISPDGRRVAWSHADVVYLHAEGAAGLEQLPVGEGGEGIDGLAFDDTGRRLAVVTSLAIAVYAVDGLRPIFRVTNPSWVHQDVRWSADNSALLVERDAQGSVLLDADTGARFAAVDAERGSVLGGRREFSPDLRYTISYGGATWSLDLLPAPDDAAPEASLKRVLAESGLMMDGVEITFGAQR